LAEDADESTGAYPAIEAAAPGAGIEVRLARADGDTGYMQVAVFGALLSELGYTVSDPSEAEVPPDRRPARGIRRRPP